MLPKKQKYVNLLEVSIIVHEFNKIFSQLKSFNRQITNFGFNLYQVHKPDLEDFKRTKKHEIPILIEKANKLNKKILDFNQEIFSYGDFWNFKLISFINIDKLESLLWDLTFDIHFYPQEYKTNYWVDTEEYLNKLINDIKNDKYRPPVQLENLFFKTNDIIQEVSQSLFNFMNEFTKKSNKFNLEEISKSKYSESLLKINCVYGFGLSDLGLFLSGKLLEEVILEYAYKLSQKNKLNKTYDEIKEMSAENRLGCLKSKFISEKEYNQMMVIKFDRNALGHSCSEEEFSDILANAEIQIIATLNLVEKMLIKIKLLEN